MDFERVLRKPRLLRALTSLDLAEFERLVGAMETVWQEQRATANYAGQARQRRRGAGAAGALPNMRAKLVFLLFYFKCYPLQEAMGVLFGLSQGQVSHWVGVLTPLVNAALGRALLLPARRPRDLVTLLEQCPELRLLLIDGTERPIRRPQDPTARTEDYSGKKKAHRKKNLVVTSEKRVVYLSPTVAGRVHDKALADQSELSLPADALLIQDSGFQGYAPPGVAILQPYKKPRGRELAPKLKQINQIIAKVRVGIEHVFSGIKRCRIVADTFRNWRPGLVDAVMEAASGLHNLRVLTRPSA